MQVIWTDEALTDIRHIFEFYAEISDELGQKIVDELVRVPDVFESGFAEMGPLEPLLEDLEDGFRYILSGHFKFIYWINDAEIVLAAVFDTRQHPKKLMEQFRKKPE